MECDGMLCEQCISSLRVKQQSLQTGASQKSTPARAVVAVQYGCAESVPVVARPGCFKDIQRYRMVRTVRIEAVCHPSFNDGNKPAQPLHHNVITRERNGPARQVMPPVIVVRRTKPPVAMFVADCIKHHKIRWGVEFPQPLVDWLSIPASSLRKMLIQTEFGMVHSLADVSDIDGARHAETVDYISTVLTSERSGGLRPSPPVWREITYRKRLGNVRIGTHRKVAPFGAIPRPLTTARGLACAHHTTECRQGQVTNAHRQALIAKVEF